MPLPYADPHKNRTRWYTALESFGRSRPGQFVARHVTPRIDPWLFRATGGRYPSKLGGESTAPLLSIGAKSGQPREHQLTYFHDGEDAIVIASNYGGPKHPQWYYNLKANPACEFGDDKFIASEVTDPEDYKYLYGLATKVYAGWGDYRLKTDPIGRLIPVFRLSRANAATGAAVGYGPPLQRPKGHSSPRKTPAAGYRFGSQKSSVKRGCHPEADEQPVPKLTFQTFSKTWMAQRDLKDRTREHYEKLLDHHIVPTFGVLPIASITADDVRAWHAKTGAKTPTLHAHAYGVTPDHHGNRAQRRHRLSQLQVPG